MVYILLNTTIDLDLEIDIMILQQDTYIMNQILTIH
jgi:hypothetical protein